MISPHGPSLLTTRGHSVDVTAVKTVTYREVKTAFEGVMKGYGGGGVGGQDNWVPHIKQRTGTCRSSQRSSATERASDK
eukprot:310402-Hanusia_phi.AAC.3